MSLSRKPDRVPSPHDERGQSIAEFALVVPVLLLILLGAIDLGRVYFGWVNLNNAARIAANYAAVNTSGPFTAGSEYDTTVRRDTTGINCSGLTVPAPVYSPDSNVGSTVSVTLTCNFQLAVPFLGPVSLTATSNFPVRGGTIVGVPNPPDPPCVAPNWIVASYSGMTVSVARTAWYADGGGSFLPSGFGNNIVVGQIPDAGTCAVPGARMVVEHQRP